MFIVLMVKKNYLCDVNDSGFYKNFQTYIQSKMANITTTTASIS